MVETNLKADNAPFTHLLGALQKVSAELSPRDVYDILAAADLDLGEWSTAVVDRLSRGIDFYVEGARHEGTPNKHITRRSALVDMVVAERAAQRTEIAP